MAGEVIYCPQNEATTDNETSRLVLRQGAMARSSAGSVARLAEETERRLRLEEAQMIRSRLVSTFNGVVVNLY